MLRFVFICFVQATLPFFMVDLTKGHNIKPMKVINRLVADGYHEVSAFDISKIYILSCDEPVVMSLVFWNLEMMSEKLMILFALLSLSAGRSLYVCEEHHCEPQCDDINDCTSKWCCTIQYALSKARPGDTILLNGIFYIPKPIHINTTVNLSKYENSNATLVGDNSKFIFRLYPPFYLTIYGIQFSNFQNFMNIAMPCGACGFILHNCVFRNFKNLLNSSHNNVNTAKPSSVVHFTVIHCTFSEFSNAININDGMWNISIQSSSFSNVHALGQNVSLIKKFSTASALTIVTKQPCNVSICDCAFKGLSSALIWGFSSAASHLLVVSSNFSNNDATYNDTVSILANVAVNILDTYFTNNSAQRGGALKIINPATVTIDQCHFIGNHASVMAGACFLNSATAVINNSHFIDNSVILAGSNENQEKSSNDGGAVYNIGKLWIQNTFFVSNTAPAFGGAIYHSSKNPLYTELMIDHVDITGPDQNLSYVGGLMYANALINATWLKLTAPTAVNYGSLLYYYNVVHYNETLARKTHLMVDISCPSNYHLKRREVRNDNHYDSLIYFCSACDKGTYSLDNANDTFNSSNNSLTKNSIHHIQCVNCPIGGICDHGIRSSDNFWGYVNEKNFVTFIPCPSSYCCTNNTCTSYNTCAKNRTGLLCGNCLKNLQENMYSTECMEVANCSPTTFWIIYIIAAICYVLVVMYFKEIVNFFTLLLKCSFGSIVVQRPRWRLYTEVDDVSKYRTLEGYADIDQPVASEASRRKNNKMSTTGVLKIVIFFYQVVFLLNVDATSKQDYKMYGFISTFVTRMALFTAVLSSQSCPYDHMNAVGKEFIKISFIIIIFSIFVLVFCVLRVRAYFKKDDSSENHSENTTGSIPLVLRVKCACLQMLLLTFLPIVTFMFQMLHCVHIYHDKENILSLYIYAEYKCFGKYLWWQPFIIVLLIVWVFPFCIMLHWNIKHLQENKVKPSEFLWHILFPLLKIFQKRSIDICNLTGKEIKEAEQFLHTFIAPYKRERSHWEVLVILRRIVLSIVYVFCINPVERLYIMIFILSVILLDHLRVQPYKGKFLNGLETVSLVLLNIFAAMNIFWAESSILSAKNETFLGNTFIALEIFGLCLPVILFVLFLSLLIVTKLYFACRRCCGKRLV